MADTPLASTRRDFLAVLGLASVGLQAAGTDAAAAQLGAGQQAAPPPTAAQPALAPAQKLPSAAANGKFGPADPPRMLQPSSADMGSLFAQLTDVALANRGSLLAGSPPKPFDEALRETVRARVREILSWQPPKVDLAPEVLERVDCGDYFRERVVYSTTPWFRVPAYVLVPKKMKGPAPAIVDLHSHGGMFLFGKEKVIDLGDNHPVMTDYHQKNYDGRPTATELVKRGFVVISADTFMFGERRLIMDEDLRHGWDRSRYTTDVVQQLNQKCRAKESTLAKSLALAGATWPGIVAWDDRRAVDYLCTRNEVDPARIGCIGISMGGYRSTYLAALDTRIAAACIVGFMSSTGPMLQAHIDTHSWVHFLPGLHRVLDLPELAALTAPRGLFVQQCSQDRLFPLTGMQAAVDRVHELYRAGGDANRLITRFYDAPHKWTIEMQDEAFAWLAKQLNHA
ncbi:MAG TPA: alpha/beta hydrolase family protein [Pirellulaceae bacterium]|nr:alpha/beta hydrolase family protein [Pirellulaceae bacterium]